MLMENRSVKPVKVFEVCGHCHARDITPGFTSATKIGGVWYHEEKLRPCGRLHREKLRREPA